MAERIAQMLVDVLVPVAVDAAYSYRVPAGMDVRPGDLVSVPLGARHSIGVVWPRDEAAPTPQVKLKEITEKLDLPPLPADLIAVIEWAANYTLAAKGMVLRMALRFDAELGDPRARIGVRVKGEKPKRMTAARGRVLSLLSDGFVRPKMEAAKEAGVSPGVVDGLIGEGTLEAVELPPEPIAKRPELDFTTPKLTGEQRKAADLLGAAMRAEDFSVHLLDGVTGSGKTEVYFEAIADAVRAGKQALILLPEIALTGRFLDRFKARFGVRPAEWHSLISPRKRARTWEAVANGEIFVVAGARSALFLPFKNLALIVVDEEHDPAYKQEDGVHYHARDMAVVRAQQKKIPIVLASATPSLETEVNARRERYIRIPLFERFGGNRVPPLSAIDLRKEGPAKGRWIAPHLEKEIAETIARKEQALLFLNRRGYAPLTLCRSCGHRLRCPNCDAWLVEHRFKRKLVCHHCGHESPPPDLCPKCEKPDSFTAIGPGVERLEEEARGQFPDARILVLSSDLIGGVERMQQELESITRGEIDIVIGTQLVAKGHHFPGLALVGVIDADLGLGQGDPRAAERTFQLLHQVVGRAGREATEGRGFLQTYQPEHPVMQALVEGDRQAFYDREIAAREEAGLPPFGRLASLIVSADEKAEAEGYARRLVSAAPYNEGVRILGPAEAPLSLVRGRHRFRLLLKSGRMFDLSGYLRDWLAAAPPPRGSLKVAVDVDPQSFL